MSTTSTFDTSLLWGLREAVVPVAALAVILWMASFELTVSPAWMNDAAPSSRAPRASLVVPVEGVRARDLTNSFTDPRSGRRTHHAIDVMAPAGRAVVAAARGTVVKRTTGRLGGKSVYVLSLDSMHVYYYAHLSTYAAASRPGTQVEKGDRLGTVGTTGNATTPHLHFAIWAQETKGPPWVERPVNPYPLLR